MPFLEYHRAIRNAERHTGKSMGGKEGEVALIEAYRNVDPA